MTTTATTTFAEEPFCEPAPPEQIERSRKRLRCEFNREADSIVHALALIAVISLLVTRLLAAIAEFQHYTIKVNGVIMSMGDTIVRLDNALLCGVAALVLAVMALSGWNTSRNYSVMLGFTSICCVAIYAAYYLIEV